MYWDINKTLSYNKLFNFIIGNRGGGKTYGSKKWCMNRYLRTAEQFIYLRRYDTEVKSLKGNFFSAMDKEFSDHELTQTRMNELLIDGETCGRIMALTKCSDIKSLDYPRVYTIVFDEFLIEQGIHHYIKNEVKVFLNFYETIARMRDVRVIFLANAVSVINPYFKYFGITLPFGSRFNSGDEWLIELVADEEFIQEKKKTRFAKLIQGTEYEQYSIENKFVNDITSFVEKKSGNCSFRFTMIFDGVKYGVWTNRDNGLCYIDNDVDNSCTISIAFRVQDFTEDYTLVPSPNSDSLFSFILMHYKRGSLRFGSLQAKEAFVKIANLR